MKKFFLALVAVFLLFWLMTDPRGLADTSGSVVSAIWGGTQQFFGAVIDFVAEMG